MPAKMYWSIVAGVGALVACFIIYLLNVEPAAGPTNSTDTAGAARSADSSTPAAVPQNTLAALPSLAMPEEQVTETRKKLKQIAIALHNYHDVKKGFPPGRVTVAPKLSWRVLILPYLEQKALYERFHLDEPWDSLHNKALLDLMPDFYRSGNEAAATTRFLVFTGKRSLFPPTGFSTIARCADGTSNTLLVVNTGGGKSVPWTKPEDMSLDSDSPIANLGLINGRMEGVLADVHAISLPGEVEKTAVQALMTPNGSEVVDGHGLANRYAPGGSGAPTQAVVAPPPGARGMRPQELAMQQSHVISRAMLDVGRGQWYPPAIEYRETEGRVSPGLSWRVRLLSFLEQGNLFKQYKRDKAWDDAENQQVLAHMPGAFRLDSKEESTSTRVQVFRGEDTPFGKLETDDEARKKVRGPDPHKFPDGQSKTIMFVASGADRAVPWTEPRDLEFDPAHPVESLGKIDENGTLAVTFDGAVRTITPDMAPNVFRSLVLISDEALAKREKWAVATNMPTASQSAATAPQPAGNKEAGPNTAAPAGPIQDGVFTLPRPGLHAGYDVPTGHLMVAEYENNRATIYKLESGPVEVKSVACPARPTVVLAKQFQGKSYFLVGGELDKRVDIFAAESGELAGSIYIQTPSVIELATSQAADDPYVYYLSRFGQPDRLYVGRFNLASKADDGLIYLGTHIGVSSDGKYLYVIADENSTRRLQLLRVVERPVAMGNEAGMPPSMASCELIARETAGTEDFVVAPNNRCVGMAYNLVNADLSGGRGAFDFWSMAFAGTQPWVAGIDKGVLKIASINDFRTAASRELPEQFDHKALANTRVEDPFKRYLTHLNQLTPLFMDDQRKCVIATAQNRVAIFHWGAIGLQDEPVVGVDAVSQASVTIGDPLEIDVKPLSANLNIRVASGPQGAALQDGKLKWKPKAEDIGNHKILIESTHNNLKCEQSVDVRVARPSVALPFAAQHISLSPDGKLAVAWEQPEDDYGRKPAGPGRLAVIDVAARKVLGTKDVQKGIWLARINGQGVFVLTMPPATVAEDSALEVFRLNLPDLKLGATVNARGLRRVLDFAGEKYLVACDEMFSQPDLKRLYSFLDPNRTGLGDRSNHMLPMMSHIDEGWLLNGVVWDEKVAHAQFLVRPRGIARHPSNNYEASTRNENEEDSISSYGLLRQGLQIMSKPGSSILSGQNSQQVPIVLRDIPAAVLNGYGTSSGLGQAYSLHVHELSGGSESQQVPLFVNRPRLAQASYSSQERAGLPEIDAAGDVVAAVSANEVFLASTKEINRASLSLPFRFRRKQNPILLGGNPRVSYELADGAPPFEVKIVIEGIEQRVQSQRAVVLPLDLDRITAAIYQKVGQFNWIANVRRGDSKETSKDVKERVLDYVDAVTPQFKMITGHEPKGVPLLVPAYVEATDRDLKIARLVHYYLLDLPTQKIVLAFAPGGQTGPSRPTARGRRQPPASIERIPLAKATTSAPKAERESRTQRLADLDRQIVIEYSEKLRQNVPSREIELAELKEKAAAAKQAAGAVIKAKVAELRTARQQQPRVWSDKKGHRTEGTLKSVFADEVVLRLTTGNEVTVPIEKLSDDDQKYLDDSKRSKPDELEIVVGKMTLIGQGITKHQQSLGRFPPGYIVSKDGRPLLSWRVAILPYVGAEDLFSLFHFDEPWDSTHNRALLEYMPAVFAPGASGSGPRTPFLAFRHPRSLLEDGRAVEANEARSDFGAAAFAEVSLQRAVEWTKPDDIPAGNLAALGSWIKDRRKAYLVGFVGGRVQGVPAETPQKSWLNLIDYKSKSEVKIDFRDPFSLMDSGPVAAANSEK